MLFIFLSLVWYEIIENAFVIGIQEFIKFESCSSRFIFSFELSFTHTEFDTWNLSFSFKKIHLNLCFSSVNIL